MLCKYILLFLQVGENTAKIVFKKKKNIYICLYLEFQIENGFDRIGKIRKTNCWEEILQQLKLSHVWFQAFVQARQDFKWCSVRPRL